MKFLKISNLSLWVLFMVVVVAVLFLALVPNSTIFRRNFSEEARPKSARLLIVGDLLFDRTIRAYAEEHGYDYIFECVADEFLRADAVLANLEGPITRFPSVSTYAKIGDPNNTRFTMPLDLPETLRKYHISILNLGNNHIRDFGPDGIISTVQALDSASLSHFGEPDEYNLPTSKVVSINGVRVAFVNYNDWFGDADTTVQQIKRHEKSYPIIVYTHWGEEYVPASQRLKNLARRFVDAGADLVVGSHPHIVLEKEIYRNVPIYYSLGNFIFDQYWDETVRAGKVLEIEMGEDKIANITDRLVDIGKNRQTCFADYD